MTTPAFGVHRSAPVEFRLGPRPTRQRRRHGEQILRTHRPNRRRLRLVFFAGFPIPALVSRCRCCGAVWPCRELFRTLRDAVGWTQKLDKAFAGLRREGLG